MIPLSAIPAGDAVPTFCAELVPGPDGVPDAHCNAAPAVKLRDATGRCGPHTLPRFDADGAAHPRWPQGECGMVGHAERGCSTRAEHLDLVREGVGFSSVPGPSGRELVEETLADTELMADEWHGRRPSAEELYAELAAPPLSPSELLGSIPEGELRALDGNR